MRLWALLVLAVLVVACGSDEAPGTTGTPAPDTPTPSPEAATFPYTWTEEDIEITVTDVVSLGDRTNDFGETNQVVQVLVTFRNLAHENRCQYAVSVGGLFAVKTDRGNLYESGALFHVCDFAPEETKDTQAGFSMRPDERPVELWQYEVLNAGAPVSQQLVTRIWRLE